MDTVRGSSCMGEAARTKKEIKQLQAVPYRLQTSDALGQEQVNRILAVPRNQSRESSLVKSWFCHWMTVGELLHLGPNLVNRDSNCPAAILGLF